MTEYQKIVIGKKFKDIQIPSENIYNLILRSPEIQNKTPRYQSKYSNKTKKFYGSKKKPHQTMGYAKTPLKSPAEYLKKHTRETKPNKESKPFSCLDISHKRPPVPKKEDAPLIIHEGKDKNFISLNKLDVIRKPALRPARKSVDTQKGDSFFLEFSGLVPKFCMKKGLRANWERLNTQYMSLPLVIDTKSLKSRKLELERKLDLLEHDIYFLEKNEENDIYVLPE
ncbi:enkurin-like isoform X2 [Argiope bruennichi]|uniref:Enkurin like protein n=1 Tax=Argiope bruennichi TaxID=94029 RepID=A0A8T0FYK5_ARGBR|nr:enkurin-like isoform X2 [Argiope bruennichi]KAF8795345.1 Enkurin like protein [Argiope bruennichi]